VVKGTSGAGKTTVCAELARRLDLPHIELDAIHHLPNWTTDTPEEFRRKVSLLLEESPDGWIIDGNYDSKLGDVIVSRADTILWLDLPLYVKLVRTARRSLQRITERKELWNGNKESWRDAFLSRDSVTLWAIGAHRRHRREWPARFAGDRRLVRLRSRREVRTWIEAQPNQQPSPKSPARGDSRAG
jgi:adenylate kinase family enzyme